MSGGAYDYIYTRVREAAGEVARRHPDCNLHRTFARLLEQVADALYEVEWADSGDTDGSKAEAAIREVVSPQQVLETSVERAEKAAENLRKALEEARNGR